MVGTHLDDVRTEAVRVANLVHVLLQIHVQELEAALSARRASRATDTRYSFDSEWTMSSRRTIVSCFISLSREISRIAVDGTPSSSASRRIFLRATIALVCVSLSVSVRD